MPQELRLRLDFLGQNVSWLCSFRNSGPQLFQTSTNAGLFMTKIKWKSCCRSFDEGEKSHIDLDNYASVFMSHLQFKHYNKLLTFELHWIFIRQFLLSNAALWAIRIHLTELHRVRVDRVGVSRLPADQSSFWTAATLPLLDHRRRRH